jgi:hypothetical protein
MINNTYYTKIHQGTYNITKVTKRFYSSESNVPSNNTANIKPVPLLVLDNLKDKTYIVACALARS